MKSLASAVISDRFIAIPAQAGEIRDLPADSGLRCSRQEQTTAEGRGISFSNSLHPATDISSQWLSAAGPWFNQSTGLTRLADPQLRQSAAGGTPFYGVRLSALIRPAHP